MQPIVSFQYPSSECGSRFLDFLPSRSSRFNKDSPFICRVFSRCTSNPCKLPPQRHEVLIHALFVF